MIIKKKVQCTAHFKLAYATGNTEPTINDIGKKKTIKKKQTVFNIVHVLCHKYIKKIGFLESQRQLDKFNVFHNIYCDIT